MQKLLQLKLTPSQAADEKIVREHTVRTSGHPASSITGLAILKKSIDSRGRKPWVMLTIRAYINEPYYCREIMQMHYCDVSAAKKKVLIIGAGPAGLFAALKLIEEGIKPIVLERGREVRARRRDLAIMNKEGIVNPESNYCFGEGGAGTYSDGKLYTRSTKRGDLDRILNILVSFGAQENILYDAHPHIGTNKLPQIISHIRERIVACGGEFIFESKVTDFSYSDQKISEVYDASGKQFHADAIILATGHSARDIFQLLHQKNIEIEFKPFALGVRIEHPQELIDQLQYHGDKRDPLLPPASYSLVEQIEGKAVFSFCMCPGGIIAPAATAPDGLVVNGWSPSKRNNPFANAGMVVAVEARDLGPFINAGPLAGLAFQRSVEEKAFTCGGGRFVAPAQRMADFADNKISQDLPACSYLPGLHSSSLKEVLPDFIYARLRKALLLFGKKMKGYYSNEAIVVATESRTSSPVRIPRNKELLFHPQVINLYPCGEGAGYAGGIMSAAMDGERVAAQIAKTLRPH